MLDVPGGMFPDDIDQGRVGLVGVVQVGDAIAQPRSQMEERGRGFARHASVAVRRAGRHPFKEAEHPTHGRNAVQAGHKVHLRRARVHKTDVHAAVDEGVNQTFCAVHREPFRR